MNEAALKHVIALLPEDARRVQQLEPNAGTEARIWIATEALSETASNSDSQKPHNQNEAPGIDGLFLWERERFSRYLDWLMSLDSQHVTSLPVRDRIVLDYFRPIR